MAEKSWRNFELVFYEDSTDLDKLFKALERTQKWAWILHDKDVGKESHYHAMVQPKSPMKTSVIANTFGVRENQIENIKGTWADALDYLTHGNAPEKHQYDASEVHANFDWETEAQKSTRNTKRKLAELIDGIGTGEIRHYNLTEHVSVADFTTYRRKIESAFKWRDEYVHAHLEELVEMKNIVWVYGKTGTGKTTFSKQLAKTYGFISAITSCGRNMFDEYKDEPCLIMDDLRPSDMRFSDLLGILDPYNFKAAQARYQNKALQTQMIIVTTTYTPERFCRECNGDELGAEDSNQLYRRINAVYEMTDTEAIEYEYDEELKRVQTQRWPNFWLMQAKRKAQKAENRRKVDQMAEMLLAEMGTA